MSIQEVAGIREGDILAGKYRVDRLLGVGGMGAVVAAHHIQLDDRVAIKFLLPEVRQSGEAVARFLREARAAVKIKSQHVARVTDVGTLENGLTAGSSKRGRCPLGRYASSCCKRVKPSPRRTRSASCTAI
jgi:serine/threonine protein kinase